MKYLSVCSGIEAASVAWKPLGWTPVAFSEIEPFPCAVLKSRFPEVPNLGDMSKIHFNHETNELTNGTTTVLCEGGIDLLVGGTPCQSWSSAGTRTGLDGASGLAYHFARLVGEVRPRWFVWENVEGCLTCRTHGDTRDFNFLLHSFASGGNPGLGPRWHVCWRVLDAQYVRVDGFPRAIPQRRKRIFLVGRLAEPGVDTCEVLLEPEWVLGDDRPRRQAGEVRAGGLPACSLGTGVAEPVERRIINYKADLAGGEPDTAMVTGDHDSRPTDFTNVIVTRDVAPDGSVHRSARRITPIEGERLQGFPDGWTRPCFTKEQIEDDETIDEFIGVHATWNAINGKPDAKAKTMKSIQKWMETLSSDKCPEGARYKAIGNSMPVNSMRWIGMRIEESERNRK